MRKRNQPLLPSAVLARKLNLLLETVVAEGGKPYSYTEISEEMKNAGTPLSRARWQYMKSGNGPDPSDADLLTNLAKFFKVDPEYLLTENAELPERIDAQLELLRTMRVQRVRSFAARQLQDLSPETLREIRDMIDEKLGDSRP